MTPTPPQLKATVLHALSRAMAKDRDGLVDDLADIGDWGLRGVCMALVSWSAVSLKCLTGSDGPGRDPASGTYALQVVSAETGKVVGSEAMSDPADRQAAQLLTLYGNDDFDTIVAIAAAAWADNYAADLMLSSVHMAAVLAANFTPSQEGAS